MDDVNRHLRGIDEELNKYQRMFQDAFESPGMRALQKAQQDSGAVTEWLDAQNTRFKEIADQVTAPLRELTHQPNAFGPAPDMFRSEMLPLQPPQMDFVPMFDVVAEQAAEITELRHRVDALATLHAITIEEVTALQLEVWPDIERH